MTFRIIALRAQTAAQQTSRWSASAPIASSSRLVPRSKDTAPTRAFSSPGMFGRTIVRTMSSSLPRRSTGLSPTLSRAAAAPARNQVLPKNKRFVPGKYYAPRHLNLEKLHERRVFRARPLLGPPAAEAKEKDLLHQLKLRPGHPSLHDDSYKNPVLLSSYVTEMGKIQKRSQTGLTWRSQREVGKAVRRARAMGLMPVMRRNVNDWIKS